MRRLITLFFGSAACTLAMLSVQPVHGLDLPARNVQFSGISTEHGLSSEFVHDIVQDAQGYVWFATQSGLNRFDGATVAVYESRTGMTNSLSNNFVWSLLVDRDGAMWVGTNRGANTYDATADGFNRTPLGGALANERVRTIFEDSTGRLWFGTVDRGLLRVSADREEVTRFEHDPEQRDSLPANGVLVLLEDRSGQIWVGTDGGGLARLNPQTDRFQVLRHDPERPGSLSNDQVRALHEDVDGHLWVGTAEGGLNRLTPGSREFERYGHDPDDPFSLPAGQVRAVYQDREDALWIGTDSGLAEWRADSNRFLSYRSDPADRGSLINNRVNDVFEDRSGVLWLATQGGVSSWNRVSDTFTYYRSLDNYLQADVVTSVAETSDGRFWVGTFGGGLSVLDLQSGEVRHYRNEPDDPSSLADDRVMTVHVAPDDTVWVGTRKGGLLRLRDDGGFDRFGNDPQDADSLSGNAVTRILTDRSGTLWVAVFGGGLNRMTWDKDRARFERFVHDPDDPTTLSGDRVLALLEDIDGYLWVGTENAGLNRMNSATGEFVRFDIDAAPRPDGKNPVDGTPLELFESADGTMWIGTLGLGLLRWESPDRINGRTRFAQFSTAEGLAPEIYGVVQGQDDALWLSSSRGLFRFHPTENSVRRFDRSNGLRSNEFNHGARLASRSGRLLFGGMGGLVGFFPAELPHNTLPPKVALEARSRDDVIARTDDNAGATVELGYSDPFVAFEFVALDFVSPDKNAYRYRLDGHEDGWTDADGYRRAVYSNLPAGSYRFEVQASNNDGVWNRDGASIEVRVIPPPWRSDLAFALYGALILGAGIGLYMRSMRQRRLESERREQLEKLVAERTRDLAKRNDELTELNRRFKEASLTDQLTGLRNRRFVDKYMEEAIAGVRRRIVESSESDASDTRRDSSKLLFVMMIDLDGFKTINDRFGHHAGDLALIEVKNRLNGCIRKSDVVTRWGGDEFLIIGHVSSFDGAKALAEKIRVALVSEVYLVGPDCEGRLSGSIGVAAIPFVEGAVRFGSWEQVVAVADQGAYLAKHNGRDAWVSMRGMPTLTEDDMQLMKERLVTMVEQDKIVVDSSLGDALNLDPAAPAPRRAIG